MLLFALASAVELKPESKKQKRGVAFFGSPGYDFFGIVPAFGSSSWAPTGLAASAWNPPSTPDIALAQVQVQATHNVALQVRCKFITHRACIGMSCRIIRFEKDVVLMSSHDRPWKTQRLAHLPSRTHPKFWERSSKRKRRTTTSLWLSTKLRKRSKPRWFSRKLH